MELNEEQLKNVVAGPNKENSEEIALKNAELFREKKINELATEKERLQELKQSYMATGLEKSSSKSK